MKDTAETALNDKRVAVLATLDQIRDAVESYGADKAREPGRKFSYDWGHVGSMNHLEELLTEASEFIRE